MPRLKPTTMRVTLTQRERRELREHLAERFGWHGHPYRNSYTRHALPVDGVNPREQGDAESIFTGG